MSVLDINVGDIVQIRFTADRFVGHIGKVIGIRLVTVNRTIEPYMFLYTVKLSNKDSIEVDASKLTIVRSVKPHESGRKDITYERR